MLSFWFTFDVRICVFLLHSQPSCIHEPLIYSPKWIQAFLQVPEMIYSRHYISVCYQGVSSQSMFHNPDCPTGLKLTDSKYLNMVFEQMDV